MSAEILIAVMFCSLIFLIVLGMPFAFAMGGIGATLMLMLWGPKQLFNLVLLAWGQSTAFMLLPIPLFILMGNLLRYSGIVDDLFEMAHRWIGRVPGGLAVVTVTIGTVVGALTGASAGATVLLGIVALPPMLKRGYDRRISVGTVAAAGSLALLIPPSVDPVIFGYYAEISIGKLLIAGVGPGMLMSSFCALYLILRCFLQPHLTPKPAAGDEYTWREKIVSVKAIILPAILVLLVLGTIYLGITTPTESAGMGAVGAFAVAGMRRRLNWSVVRESAINSARLSVFILWVIIGGAVFATVLSYGGGSSLIQKALVGLSLGQNGTIILMLIIIFIMGMFMDPTSIVIITVPVFLPIVREFGSDPIWFGTLFLMVLLTSFLTPPIGYNLFYVKAIAPEEINMGHIYRGIIPFVVILLICVAFVFVIPEIAIFLPAQMK